MSAPLRVLACLFRSPNLPAERQGDLEDVSPPRLLGPGGEGGPGPRKGHRPGNLQGSRRERPASSTLSFRSVLGRLPQCTSKLCRCPAGSSSPARHLPLI